MDSHYTHRLVFHRRGKGRRRLFGGERNVVMNKNDQINERLIKINCTNVFILPPLFATLRLRDRSNQRQIRINGENLSGLFKN
jgi:hypothetical protein